MLEVPFALFPTTKNQLVCIQGGETKVIPFPVLPYKFVEDGGEDREPYHVIGENTTKDIGRIEYPSIPTVRKPGRIDSLTPELDYVLDLVKDHPDIITGLSNGKDPYPIFLDIETAATEEHFPKPERDPIICIQLKYPGEKEVVIHETSQIGEKEILRQTIDYIKSNPVTGLSPDMVVGFFLNKFDIPYMYERVKRNGLTMEWHSLDRTPEGASMFYPRWLATRKLRSDVMMDFARGLVNLDLYLHVKADNLLKELPRKGLKQSSAFYGFTEVFDIEAEQKMDMRTLMTKDYDTFMKYAISDILATEYLYNIYIHRLIAGANLLRCPMGLIHRMSSGQKSYVALYREAKENKYLSVKSNNHRYAHLYDRAPKYQGAMVDCFAKGYFEKTIYVDAKCVHGDTLITTDYGDIPISNLEVGDVVRSNIGYSRVVHKEKTTRTDRVRITTRCGKSIIVSKEHRFPVWLQEMPFVVERIEDFPEEVRYAVKTAAELTPDDVVHTFYQSPDNSAELHRLSKILSVEPYVNTTDKNYMFDIMVENQDYPYFFGNGILTHNSLYPNIMYDFNISPDRYTLDTVIEYDEVMAQRGIDNEDDFNPEIEVDGTPESMEVLIPDDNYEAYLKFRCNFIDDGYIRGLIDYYNGERDKFKKQAQIHAEKFQESRSEEDRINADMYDSMQQEAKILNNTMYGVQGDKYSDIGDLPAAIFVTAIGRWIMGQMVDYFGKGTVLEIDTDGLLLNRDHVHQSIEEINEELRNRLHTTFGIPKDKMKFKLEFEGAGSVYLYKSKNYILRVDGKDKLTVKGSAFTGYDKAPVIKRSVTLFADAIMFKTMSFSEAERQSLDIYSLPREDFMFSKTLKKKPEGYKGFEDISTYIQAVDHTNRSSREVLQEMKNRAVDWINTRYKNEDSRTKFTKMIRRCKSEDQMEMVINAMPAVKGRTNARYFMLDLIMRLIFKGKTVEEEDTIEYYWTLTSEKETLAEDMTDDTPIDYERYIIEIGRVIDRFRYADPEELEMDFSLFLDAQEDQIEADNEEDEEDE